MYGQVIKAGFSHCGVGTTDCSRLTPPQSLRSIPQLDFTIIPLERQDEIDPQAPCSLRLGGDIPDRCCTILQRRHGRRDSHYETDNMCRLPPMHLQQQTLVLSLRRLRS